MTELERIRERLETAQHRQSDVVPCAWHIDDVISLLHLADAALAYRAATQVPDGVAAAEQVLFEVLEGLEVSK